MRLAQLDNDLRSLTAQVERLAALSEACAPEIVMARDLLYGAAMSNKPSLPRTEDKKKIELEKETVRITRIRSGIRAGEHTTIEPGGNKYGLG